MRSSSKLVLFVLLFVFAGAELAFAKRGIRIPMFIRLPGPDPVVKVIELPDTAIFRHGDGIYIDIGYLHHSSSSGEWVGYVGSGTEYLSLSETNLKLLMRMGNIAELPPPPSYNGGWLDKYGIYLLILGAILAFGALKAVVRAVLRSRDNEPAAGQSNDALEAAMSAAIKQNRSIPAAAPTPFGTAPGGARASFGKRV